MKQHELTFPRLTQTMISQDVSGEVPLTLTVNWKKFATLHIGDDVIITNAEGLVWLGEIEDIGDPEFGQNWIAVNWS